MMTRALRIPQKTTPESGEDDEKNNKIGEPSKDDKNNTVTVGNVKFAVCWNGSEIVASRASGSAWGNKKLPPNLLLLNVRGGLGSSLLRPLGICICDSSRNFQDCTRVKRSSRV